MYKEFKEVREVREERSFDKNLKFSNLSKFLKFSNLPPPYAKGICCEKVANLVPIKRKSGWDILSVFPIRYLD